MFFPVYATLQTPPCEFPLIFLCRLRAQEERCFGEAKQRGKGGSWVERWEKKEQSRTKSGQFRVCFGPVFCSGVALENYCPGDFSGNGFAKSMVSLEGIHPTFWGPKSVNPPTPYSIQKCLNEGSSQRDWNLSEIYQNSFIKSFFVQSLDWSPQK